VSIDTLETSEMLHYVELEHLMGTALVDLALRQIGEVDPSKLHDDLLRAAAVMDPTVGQTVIDSGRLKQDLRIGHGLPDTLSGDNLEAILVWVGTTLRDVAENRPVRSHVVLTADLVVRSLYSQAYTRLRQ